MSIADIVETVKSGVVHIVHTVNGQRAASGTGFIVDGYLVTNHHVVFQAPEDSVIVLRTFDSEPQSHLDGIQLTNKDFQKNIVTASGENSYDYCVFDIPELKQKHLYNFSFSDHKTKRIGDTILFLGYPFEHLNLVCHAGIISSFYKSGVANIIQVDASVNPSNSGGPLIDPETSEVIGIITRKATGLTKTFAELRSVIKKNIEYLSTKGGIILLGGFDPINGMVANHYQILELTNEIERSANVGIGYAFSVDQLKDENIFYKEEP